VIADHIRACSFTIVDGVIPGNEGRGYVLRRIARRAIRHGYKLGARKPFFHQLVLALDQTMGEAYPELRRAAARVTDVLRQEEERFFQTIANGMEILDGALGGTAGAPGSAGSVSVLDGETAFKLHDTYGFPLDLTADVCRERGVKVDEAGFNAAMQRQREQARAAGKFKMQQGLEYSGVDTAFHGYEHLVCESSKVTALYVDGSTVQQARAGEDVVVVLDHTPFYAESGGQAGDAGELRNGSTRVVVEDTLKIQAAVFGHHGRVVEGEIKVGDTFTARVDAVQRAHTVRHHSATHLMHKALREVLGTHVQQKGSLVNADRTRFDFAHTEPMTPEQVARVEAIVNAEILLNAAAQARVMPIEEAQKVGAMMLFGEKYGDTVRVLDIGSSRELCGGTHVQRTGDIGLFKVVAEGGVAAGIRRVEAVCGEKALAYLQQLEATLADAAGAMKVSPPDVPARAAAVLDQVRTLEKEIAALKGKLASAQGDELLAQALEIKGIKVLAATLEGADAKVLRDTLDKLKDKLKTAAIVLAAVDGGKVQLAAGVTADCIGKVKAGELVNFVAQQVGGKGGGKPDMAMAGGTDPTHLPKALASVRDWIAERV
jgi:alanyl-tRNA synthetase